jgi:hypothetical protein
VGDVAQWYDYTMVQDGDTVSTPSPAEVNGSGGLTDFSTSYTGTQQSYLRERAQLSMGTPRGKSKEKSYG